MKMNAAMKFDFDTYWNSIVGWVLAGGVRVILIIVATVILLNVIGIVTRNIQAVLERKHPDVQSKERAVTLSSVLRWTLRVSVIIVAFMMLLEQVGLSIGPTLAAAGVVGVALSFGAQ